MEATRRSSTVIASVQYSDANAAIIWLKTILGFTEHAVYRNRDGIVEHAELRVGNGMVMLGTAGHNKQSTGWQSLPADVGGKVTSSLYVVVPDCTPVWDRVASAGTTILQDLRVMEYGGQAFTVRDPEGHVWSVGEYDPWAAPAA